MSWSNKKKTNQDGSDEYIYTPDFERILVGENEDQPLLWQEAFNNWTLKTKTES